MRMVSSGGWGNHKFERVMGGASLEYYPLVFARGTLSLFSYLSQTICVHNYVRLIAVLFFLFYAPFLFMFFLSTHLRLRISPLQHGAWLRMSARDSA